MKSVLTEVMGLYDAIFLDLVKQHPSIRSELERDISRLHDCADSSGLPFFTITLPSLGKYLHTCLDEERLVDPRPPLLGAKSKTDKRPKFLFGLWSNVYEPDGTLRSDLDISSIASMRQVFLAVKKLKLECEQGYVDKTIAEFRDIETSLPKSWDDTWDVDNPIWCRRDEHPLWGASTVDECQADMFDDSHTMLRLAFDPNWSGFRNFCARFSSQLGDFHPFELTSDGQPAVRPKHGPGAVSDRTSYTKYDGRYWTYRLEPLFPYDWFGAPSSEHLDYVQYREFPSQLIAVPKTQSGPRLIAKEPTAHQWIQGSIRQWLEDRLKRSILRYSVDFRDQSASQRLTLEASITRSHATVDLSSASDRLSTRLVEYVLQGNHSLLDALHASRTRCVRMLDGELMQLRKFATQGSACTFPVQTIVFSLLATWSVAISRDRFDWEDLVGFAKEVRVFGDDIIVPNDAYSVLTSLLATCGLKVSAPKSFSHGFFRESCGMDAYKGIDVTPAYCRQLYGPAPTSLESVIECSNNFFRKGWWHTADYLQKTVPSQELQKLRVVGPDSGAFGLLSFVGDSVSHLPRRWNRDTHVWEAKVLMVATATKRTRGQGHGDLLQFFIEDPASAAFTKYEGGQVSGLRQRKLTKWEPE